MSKKIRIGNASGYWGDDPKALYRQVKKGHLDYITMDFLAEITMSIMQKQKAKSSDLGYAADFLPMLDEVLEDLLKQKTTIITNAGGINPQSCADAIEKMANKKGLKPKIAVVYGDDIKESLSDLSKKGCRFKNMENGEDFSSVQDKIAAANVYFGAKPVVEALEKWKPDIIITGRVTDTGITVAPMIYEFGWSYDDWDKIASGTIAAHLMECGSQVTGGNFSDWEQVANFDEIGYPIAEVSENGEFVLTKHPHTGGYVSVDTVREQLFYEMGDPKAYITPDVVVDFSSVQLKADGKDRVKVFGVKGGEPTPFYKISMAYEDGFKSIGSILISGPNARAKAEKFAEIFWNRVGTDFDNTSTEYLGWNACHRSLGHEIEGNEILLKLGAQSQDKAKLMSFAKMVPSLILSGPPGVSVIGGVPKPHSIMSYWPALIEKSMVFPKISCYQNGRLQESVVTEQIEGNFDPAYVKQHIQIAETASQAVEKCLFKIEDATANRPNYKLVNYYDLCLARSGDKGNSANIGVLARSKDIYDFLKQDLTAQKIKDLFQEFCHGKVIRYELDGLNGLNFMLEESLGGGGSCSLRSDAQGKTFSQALLRQKVEVPAQLV